MADQNTVTTSAASGTRTAPARPRIDRLPPYNVLLHNDDENDMTYVVDCIMMLAAIDTKNAILRTLEAHTQGVSILLTTHQERAELLAEQFSSKQLKVTIEPAV
jgi:ATP-dependent Clp protease adaptor protein ClpS